MTVGVFEGLMVGVLPGASVKVCVFEGVVVVLIGVVLLNTASGVREEVTVKVTVDVLEGVRDGIGVAVLTTTVFEGALVAVLVMLGVFEAGKVALGSGVIVEVLVSVLVGVVDAVFVIVGASPDKVKEPDVFHFVPTKKRTS